MKAIIMAGGEGSRLRPLTCDRPKPMVPVANVPMMEHIVELLKQSGLTRIGVTLQYMPQVIQEYFGNGRSFGVDMQYFIEDSPLGTAGSVKNAASFLDETFLVISGDALTDFPLPQAIDFHRRRGALATLVLTRVDCPLEYGVVIASDDGRVQQFLEKPAWSEVFSDTVNTGIYILEPEVLRYVPEDRPFDFSKDLFPLLLQKRQPVLGVVLEGYWCDIGNLTQYVQAHRAVLAGQARVRIRGRQLAENIWAGADCQISPRALLRGPLLLGERCTVEAGARLEDGSVLGDGCQVGAGASVKRSVLWRHVQLGSDAALRGAVLGDRVQVLKGAAAYEGAVIGTGCLLGEQSVIKPDVKLWPGKQVEARCQVSSSLIWGTRQARRLFGLEGVTGQFNVELTPETALKLAAAFVAAQGAAGRPVGVSADAWPAAQALRHAVLAGIMGAGGRACDLGAATVPLARFAVRSLELAGGVHVRVHPDQPERLGLLFLDRQGGNISRSSERKVENLLWREDFPRAAAGQVLPGDVPPGLRESYLSYLAATIGGSHLKRQRPRLVMAFDRLNLEWAVEALARQFNLSIHNLDHSLPGQLPRSWAGYQEMLGRVAENVRQQKALAGAILAPSGDRLVLVDETGRVISDEMLVLLMALVIFKLRGGPVVVPVTAPRTVEDLARQYAARVIRTKTALPDLLEQILRQTENQDGRINQMLLNFDALGACLAVLEFALSRGLTLGQLVEEIPAFYLHKRSVFVPWEARGTVMRRMIEEPEGGELELLDGVKVLHPQGWALVLPDPEEPVCRIFSEGVSMEVAEALTDFYEEKIRQIAGMRKSG
ncbi:MAG: sugar phosphate nucleotidyltransferase [Desulfurispora sp.]|uniref:sugar phosphate nucleotidyltransferase n=1 Tax=Desulfurispora sp. TaxID=3014275 RepID=UPI00404ACBC2